MARINGSRARKMGLEEANEPKGARRERRSKPMGKCRKARMGHNRPEMMQAKKVKG